MFVFVFFSLPALNSISLLIRYIARRLQTGTHAPVNNFLGPIGPGVLVDMKLPLRQSKNKNSERRLYRAISYIYSAPGPCCRQVHIYTCVYSLRSLNQGCIFFPGPVCPGATDRRSPTACSRHLLVSDGCTASPHIAENHPMRGHSERENLPESARG